MKYLIVCMLLMGLLTNAHANCNVKTDIVKQGVYYAYSKDCHKMVGLLILNEKDRKEQVKHLNETIKLKDLAISFADKRANLWQAEADNQYRLLQRHAKWRSYEKYIWFGSGVGLAILSVYAAGQIK